MKYIILSFFLLVGSLQAAGWHDYSLDIGEGYTVFRANSLEVCIGKANGSLILSPRNYEEVGPVVAYQMKDEYIFTKNAGRVLRNAFEGDIFENVDYNKEWYFIIPKRTDTPLGPYTKEAFVKTLEDRGINRVDWVEPKNPNFWIPLLGSLMFIAIAIPILLIKYFYVSVPLFILMIWGFYYLLKRRKQNKRRHGTR